MLNELRFVQGAVAKKDLLPAMTHFRIENGHVRSYNGSMALSSPLKFDIDCNPRADQLIRAISQCTETVTLHMTSSGRLAVRSGAFRAYVDCIEGETPHVVPEGQIINFDGELLLDAIKVISPFIGEDASRPWTNGLLLRGESAFATNNVCLVEYWLGTSVPFVINIPRSAIKEILRVGEAPSHAQITDNSITFHYSDDRWIRTQLYETSWPDLAKILDRPSKPVPIDERIFEGIEMLKGVGGADAKVFIKDGLMRTELNDQEGATYEISGLDATGCYSIAMLGKLKGVVKQIDLSSYPEPCCFFGDRIRGVIVGMKF